jgi:multidrug efflux system membrane fusion protein
LVTDFVEYTGRTDAVESVGIRPRVTGYIVRAPFREGSEVRKGDLLFEIDPRPYKAQYDQAVSQVAVNEASLRLAQATYERAKIALAKGAGSQQDADQAKAAAEEAAARVEAAKATVELYRLNLDYTRVTSPIDGQVSRYFYTVGNLVNQDQTLLTTVISVDPMYAYFDMDERTLLRIYTAINEGRIKLRRGAADMPEALALSAVVGAAAVEGNVSEFPVLMGLEGEDGFPHVGNLNFANNVVNPSTGTIAIRGVFPNPQPPNGRRLLKPGMFVRIRLPIGQPHPALLVVDRAIGSDQGLRYVYVIDAENKAQYRRVKTGALEDDGLRVVDSFDPKTNSGLRPDELVVVGALQQLRPRMEVDPEVVPMPTPGAPQQTGAPGTGEQHAAQPGSQPAPRTGGNAGAPKK